MATFESDAVNLYRYTSSVPLELLYGKEVADANPDLGHDVVEAAGLLGEVMFPGATIVNVFQSCMSIIISHRCVGR